MALNNMSLVAMANDKRPPPLSDIIYSELIEIAYPLTSRRYMLASRYNSPADRYSIPDEPDRYTIKIIDILSKYMCPLIAFIDKVPVTNTMVDVLNKITYTQINSTPGLATILSNNTFMLSHVVNNIIHKDRYVPLQLLTLALQEACPIQTGGINKKTRMIDIFAIMSNLQPGDVCSILSGWAMSDVKPLRRTNDANFFHNVETVVEYMHQDYPAMTLYDTSQYVVYFEPTNKHASISVVMAYATVVYNNEVLLSHKMRSRYTILNNVRRNFQTKLYASSLIREYMVKSIGSSDFDNMIHIRRMVEAFTHSDEVSYDYFLDLLSSISPTDKHRAFLVFSFGMLVTDLVKRTPELIDIQVASMLCLPCMHCVSVNMLHTIGNVMSSGNYNDYILSPHSNGFLQFPNILFATNYDTSVLGAYISSKYLHDSILDMIGLRNTFGVTKAASTEFSGNVFNLMISMGNDSMSADILRMYTPVPAIPPVPPVFMLNNVFVNLQGIRPFVYGNVGYACVSLSISRNILNTDDIDYNYIYLLIARYMPEYSDEIVLLILDHDKRKDITIQVRNSVYEYYSGSVTYNGLSMDRKYCYVRPTTVRQMTQFGNYLIPDNEENVSLINHLGYEIFQDIYNISTGESFIEMGDNDLTRDFSVMTNMLFIVPVHVNENEDIIVKKSKVFTINPGTSGCVY